MVDDRVDTISRLAQWKIDNFGPCSYKKSDPFKVGIWNWTNLSLYSIQLLQLPPSFFARYFSIVRNRCLYIHLFPEPSRVSKEHPPLVRFILRVSVAGSPRKFHISPVYEKLLRTHDDFVWPVESTFVGRFIVDVEFLDLKIFPMNGGKASSIWSSEGDSHCIAAQSSSLHCLSRMLDEAILADLTIITAGGASLRAHKAILSASSPVFKSMFHHNLKEKESSTIHIEDMSLESCTALLSYLYGSIKQEDFRKHRLALLGAANKYDIGDLKDICEESLLEDLNSENVIEMLNEAWLYQLHKLKKGCLRFLFEFGKIYDVRDGEISNLFQHADRELVMEMFQEVLTISNPR